MIFVLAKTETIHIDCIMYILENVHVTTQHYSLIISPKGKNMAFELKKNRYAYQSE